MDPEIIALKTAETLESGAGRKEKVRGFSKNPALFLQKTRAPT